jgi:hypothetical protein
MRGCLKLFPVTPVAREGLKLAETAQKYTYKGWALSRWILQSQETLELFYSGDISQDECVFRLRLLRPKPKH